MSETTHDKRRGFFHDKDGHLVLYQVPNIPIIGWAVFKVLSMLVSQPHAKTGLAQLGSAFLFTWAYLEITKGASYFRRLLGAIVMLALLYSFFK